MLASVNMTPVAASLNPSARKNSSGIPHAMGGQIAKAQKPKNQQLIHIIIISPLCSGL
jgi:hypothetical protein